MNNNENKENIQCYNLKIGHFKVDFKIHRVLISLYNIHDCHNNDHFIG